MLKKIGFLLGILFLFFELLYFNSNSAVVNFQNDSSREKIYEVSINEKKQNFIADYQDIIVEEKEDSILVLASNQTLSEIKKKYSIKIANE